MKIYYLFFHDFATELLSAIASKQDISEKMGVKLSHLLQSIDGLESSYGEGEYSFTDETVKFFEALGSDNNVDIHKISKEEGDGNYGSNWGCDRLYFSLGNKIYFRLMQGTGRSWELCGKSNYITIQKKLIENVLNYYKESLHLGLSFFVFENKYYKYKSNNKKNPITGINLWWDSTGAFGTTTTQSSKNRVQTSTIMYSLLLSLKP